MCLHTVIVVLEKPFKRCGALLLLKWGKLTNTMFYGQFRSGYDAEIVVFAAPARCCATQYLASEIDPLTQM